jgi:hypothetical protein
VREAAQDAIDDDGVDDDRDDLHLDAAAGAEQGIHFEDLAQEAGPVGAGGGRAAVWFEPFFLRSLFSL